MNVEIGTEAAQFPEKEYKYAIFFAVWRAVYDSTFLNYNEDGRSY